MPEPARRLALLLGAVSLLAFLLFGWDKLMAKLSRRRTPEAALWACALLGGGTGAFLGMRLFRHKTRKGLFPIGVPVLAFLQCALLVWLIFS